MSGRIYTTVPLILLIVLTHVDDCVIVGNSMKEIDSFVKSMMEGLEQLILTDEEDIDKFLGIDIRHLSKNKFEIVQPFLIDRIVTLLGLANNEFDVSTNGKAIPVGKSLC